MLRVYHTSPGNGGSVARNPGCTPLSQMYRFVILVGLTTGSRMAATSNPPRIANMPMTKKIHAELFAFEFAIPTTMSTNPMRAASQAPAIVMCRRLILSRHSPILMSDQQFPRTSCRKGKSTASGHLSAIDTLRDRANRIIGTFYSAVRSPRRQPRECVFGHSPPRFPCQVPSESRRINRSDV